LDLNCGDYLASYTEAAVAMGKVKEWRVDDAVANLFAVRMRLGMFDGSPSQQPFGTLGVADVCTASHQELAVEAARQGIVLLKNDGDTLPLSKSQTLALIGPNANATHTMLGNYEGVPCKYTTPYQGLLEFDNKVRLAPGCISTACQHVDLIASAVETAATADAVVLVMGLSQAQESEALDRTSLRLPGNQERLIDQAANAAAGRPVVLVVMSGGPVDIAFAKSDKRIHSILWIGYPGQSGGQAMAEILFGVHNPGGKLPMS
jgi:beta-D-xylosidase 4